MTEPKLNLKATLRVVKAINKGFSDAFLIEVECVELPMTPTNLSFWLTDRKIAERFIAAVNAQAALTDVRVMLDANDDEYIACTCQVFGKTADADLTALGF
jgi:hypothetical protein